MKCQYETFSGPPVYYGGDLCDSKELEEYDTLDLARVAIISMLRKEWI